MPLNSSIMGNSPEIPEIKKKIEFNDCPNPCHIIVHCGLFVLSIYFDAHYF